MGFEPLNQVADVLAPLGVPWWVAGGLAVDAQVGKPTRAHADADVLVLQRDVAAVARALPQAYAERPERAEPIDWDRSSPLVPGVEALALPVRFQGGISKLQILVGRSEAGQWVYHRGRGTLRLPLEDITRRTSDGVPLPRADRHLAVQVATAPRERHRRLSDASSVARGARATVAARRHPPLAAGSSVAGGALSVVGGENVTRPDMLQAIYAVDLPPQPVSAHDLPPETWPAGCRGGRRRAAAGDRPRRRHRKRSGRRRTLQRRHTGCWSRHQRAEATLGRPESFREGS